MPKNDTMERNAEIVQLYLSERFTTEYIAKQFGLTRRRVLQIVKQCGVIRSQADGNRVATPLKSRHRVRRRYARER